MPCRAAPSLAPYRVDCRGLASAAGKVAGWIRNLTWSQVDLIMITALAIPVLLFLIWNDALERFYEYS